MDRRQDTAVDAILEQLIETGPGDLAGVFARALDPAMQIERFLGVGHYERTPERRGYANGTKPKTAGHEGEPFCPQSLERGRRPVREDAPPPGHHRKRLRTSNPIERSVQQELKRRTVKVWVFPGEDALLRLVSAVRIDIDDKWAADTKAASRGMPECLTPSRQNFQTSGCSIEFLGVAHQRLASTIASFFLTKW